MTTFTYSIGRNRFDVHPQRREAATLREFARDVLNRRARSKASAGFVSAGFGGDGRRCAANALPRNWLAVDVDGVDRDALPEWRTFLAARLGFGWPTASSTPDAPRERALLVLSEPVDRAQGMAIGALFVRDTDAEFGAAIRIDPCGFRPEQPAFLAPVGVQPFFLTGDPIDVPVWLAMAPPAPPPPPPATAETAAIADARMRHIVDLLGRAGLLLMPLPDERPGYSLICPWQAEHTSPDGGRAATALLFPSEANNWRGGFRCLHTHCSHRRLGDLLALLRAACPAAKEAA